MKATIGGKRYNSSTCEVLAENDLHSYSHNYAGTVSLLRAGNGELLVWCNSNGQDWSIQDYLVLMAEAGRSIDYFDMNDEQEARCVELGLTEIV